MRDKILIQSKLSTPRLHSKIVHRERLTSLLDEHIDKNLIILCAPAGFGKTTLILDYLSHQNLRHAWLSIPQKGIEDISSFFEYQVLAFRNLNKHFGGKILEITKPYTRRPKLLKELEYIFTASFVNEFRKYFRDDIILVIDDLHYIDALHQKEWLKNLFTNQFDNMPSNLHVIVATRAVPDINVTGAAAKRNVLFINEKELCFRKEETAALLENVYKFKYDAKDIKLLEDNVKGWITGIHLLLQAYGRDFNKIRYEGDIAYENIFDFFAQEIFDNLSPELQEFMMVTSLMDSFDIALSNKVFGIKNSRELTDFLQRKNLFFQHVNSDHDEQNEIKSYSYHSLFKNFLTKRLKNVMKEAEVRKLQEKIAEGYETSGDSVTAVNYFLESGNYNKAVQLINTNFTKIRAAGKFDIIWKWFNAVPEDFINKDPLLLLRKGHLYFTVEADSVKSLYYAKKAEELYKRENNQEGLVNSCLLKSTVLLFKGNVAEAKILLERTLKNNLKPENEVKIYRLLYFIYSEYREHQKAKELIEKAIKLCDRYKLDKSEMYMGLGIIHSKMEQYENAIIYYKKELDNSSSLYNIIMINCNIAHTYSDMGSYSKALLYFNKAFKLMEDTYSLELVIHVPCQKALLLQRIGDIEKSTSILENIFLIASKMNLVYNLMDITEYLMINYYLLNDYDNCLKYLNLNRIYTGKLNLEYYKQFFQTREALFLMKFDLDSSVIEKLINSYEYFDSIKSKYKNNILVWITNYYLQTGNQVMASKYLTEFLNNAQFRDWDLIDSRNVIDFAFSLPEMNQYKDKIHHAFAEFFERLNIEGTSEQYKRKINHEIEKLYDLKMISFGVPEFVSRGVPVPESNWRKKKGKMILAYMMLNPNAKYCKDKLIDIFFPDAKPDTVEDSFKQAVFSIRNAIKLPYINILLNADKMLYLNPDCYFKSDAEEFYKFYNIAHSNDRSTDERVWACEQAIGLYKGEFMEGNYEQWCEDIRNDFHNKLISTCELLLNLLRKCRKYDEIIHYSEILLKHDKLNEKAYLSMVEANVKLEKMKSAMESYSKMMKAYKEELSEYPDIITLNKIKVLFE